VTKKIQLGVKQDRLWAEAKRRCRLNLEDIRMAKEVGLNPRSLIKNIPSPNRRWKLPVKQWIHKLYEGKTGKPAVTKRHNSQTLKRKHAADALVPLQVYAGGPGLTGNSDNSPHPTITDWDEYAGALWDDDNPLGLSEPPLYREIWRENQRARKRQDDFRLAARYVAQACGQITGVEKVVLFGSVACPLREEKPRYRQYRRAGVLMLHECKDIDLAVWLSDSDCLRALQKARSKALNKLWQKQRIGVAHHQVDIFIMEPGSDRYLGRLCSYNQCPKGKPECRVTDCGSTPLLRQHEDFKLHTSALMPGKSTVLI
jgi:hypothetical protein